MKKNYNYGWMSAMSFMFAGNFFWAQRGWIGWQTFPAFALVLLGYEFLDRYAKGYDQ